MRSVMRATERSVGVEHAHARAGHLAPDGSLLCPSAHRLATKAALLRLCCEHGYFSWAMMRGRVHSPGRAAHRRARGHLTSNLAWVSPLRAILGGEDASSGRRSDDPASGSPARPRSAAEHAPLVGSGARLGARRATPPPAATARRCRRAHSPSRALHARQPSALVRARRSAPAVATSPLTAPWWRCARGWRGRSINQEDQET
jgi:hypothetical protein